MSREEAQEHERSVREHAKDNPVLAGALTRLGRVREAEVETETSEGQDSRSWPL